MALSDLKMKLPALAGQSDCIKRNGFDTRYFFQPEPRLGKSGHSQAIISPWLMKRNAKVRVSGMAFASEDRDGRDNHECQTEIAGLGLFLFFLVRSPCQSGIPFCEL